MIWGIIRQDGVVRCHRTVHLRDDGKRWSERRRWRRRPLALRAGLGGALRSYIWIRCSAALRDGQAGLASVAPASCRTCRRSDRKAARCCCSLVSRFSLRATVRHCTTALLRIPIQHIVSATGRVCGLYQWRSGPAQPMRRTATPFC